MRVLVTAATRHDATREIAEAIGAGLVARGIDAELRPIDEVTDLAGYDSVVLGSAIYMGRWLKPARQFAKHHGTSLAAIPVWLFSSGPLGPPANLVPTGEPADVTELVRLTGALEHRVFAGRFERERLGFAERAVGKAVRAPEGDCRDWSAIDGFAGEIAAQLGAAHLPEGGTHERAVHPRFPPSCGQPAYERATSRERTQRHVDEHDLPVDTSVQTGRSTPRRFASAVLSLSGRRG